MARVIPDIREMSNLTFDSRAREVQVRMVGVPCQCKVLTEQERRARELVLLLDTPNLSAPRKQRLAVLLASFPEKELLAILEAASPSETGCLRLPRSLRFEPRAERRLHDDQPMGHQGVHHGPIERLVDELQR